METIESTLELLGYKLNNHGHYYSCAALYRGGININSLTVYPQKDLIIDWVTGQRFNTEELVKATLNLNDINQAKEWLKNKNISITKKEEEPALKQSPIFPPEWLNELVPDHSYWINRGIKKEILEEFGGGIATDKIPKLTGRYVFTIWNSKKQLVGLQGRSLNGKNPRYKTIGEKSSFCFPLHMNAEEIKQKSEIILVEGIPDGLSLTTADIKNWMCLFGVGLSNYQLSVIIGINPKKIILALNNDGKAGNEGAIKMQKRLRKFFDKNQVEIRLPKEKDLNELLTKGGVEAINEWYKL